MIKHIVSWKINDDLEKQAESKKIKEKLEDLKGKIEKIKFLEVGIDFSQTEMSADLVLVSEFENIENLEVYQNHPEHQKVVQFIKERTNSRTLVDYNF